MSWSWILLVLTTLLSRLSNTNTFELTSDEIDRLLANVSTGRGKYFTREPTPREGHREPYWEGGHWVFDSTRYKWLSTHIRHAWRHKWDRQKYRTSSTNMWCNPVCLRVYLNYGPICAFLSTQRLVNDSDPEWWDSREWHARRGAQPGTWHARRGARPGTWHARRGAQPGTWHARRGAQPGTYGTFNSLCDLERANCMHTQYRGGWHMAYRGRCSDVHMNIYNRDFGRPDWQAFIPNKADALMFNFMSTTPTRKPVESNTAREVHTAPN